MKRETNTETKPSDPAVVEVGEVDAGINWDVPNPFTQHSADPQYAYYYAADRSGAQGVAFCKSIGYEVDPTQKSSAEGHVLMRMPIEKKRQRERAEKRRQRMMESDAINTEGKFDIPVEMGRHDFGEQGVGVRK